MHYEIDNWAFNPGSIEVTNISEFRETRGVFLVDVGDDNSIKAEHITDYRQRPFQRLLAVDVTNIADPAEVFERAIEVVRNDARPAVDGEPAPIIELTIRGQLGFPASLLELSKIRDEAQRITGALHVRMKNITVASEYAVAEDVPEDASREKVERRVVEDLVVRDNRYKKTFANVADAVIGAKRLALSDEEPEKIAEFIASQMFSNNFEIQEN